MRIVIQLLVIGVAIGLTYYLIRLRSSHSGKAWKKIGFILLMLSMVITVLFPELTDALALRTGVRDGGALFVYCLTLAFIVYALNNYLERQDERDRLLRLARKVAVLEANTRYLKK